MNKQFIKLLAVASGVLFLTSCQKDLSSKQTDAMDLSANGKSDNGRSDDKTKTFYGPAVPMGQGVGKAWVTVDANGTPITLGVTLSAKAALSQEDEEAAYTFQLPGQVAVPPFDHIELGWNPHGHEPAGTYDLPHFDLHYYMISPAYQATIPFLAPPAMDVQLPAKYTPPAYLFTPGLVPNMGAHIIDLLSPELNGQTFTKTFIYGSYKGNLIFLEPMFTTDYLTSLIAGPAAMPTAIRQPSAFQRAGYYPTSYTISYQTSPKEFVITLNNLTYHRAG
ncbi:MAG TPA: hypothetical protein VEY06_11715 [Flavisolibacter sp.]|jgi:hypothetical protein|nr:hypothetical protein [Flavisolibacter sp.]